MLTVPISPRARAGVFLTTGALVSTCLLLFSCARSGPGGETTPVETTPVEAEASGRTVISGALLIDGSGAPGREAAVVIENGIVSAIHEAGEKVSFQDGDHIVAVQGGHVLAPGFIDAHSHHDWGLMEEPAAEAAVSQGITTIIVGQDGGSNSPLEDWFAALEETPAAVNVASYSGHNSHRSTVLGDDFRRTATPEEIERMKQLVEADMDAGALGLATGLEYDPGIYSSPEEVIELAKVAAEFGGRYISHVRSEDRSFWQAIDELLEIGRQAELPVQISHVKLAMQSSIGQADRLIERLNRARAEGIEVTADIYPYTFWQSTLEVMFPERDFDNVESSRFAVYQLSTPEGIRLGSYLPEPSYAGKTLREIATLRSEEPEVTLMTLIADAQAYRRANPNRDSDSSPVESVLAVSMDEADIDRLMQWPHTVFCSDGGLRGAHPRGFGAFPRIFSHFVKERSVMPIEEAVKRASRQTAEQAGLAGRGTIAVGAPADLVLFHPDRIVDRATVEQPHLPSEGIRTVWVNGVVVWDDGKAPPREPQAALPGKVLRRH